MEKITILNLFILLLSAAVLDLRTRKIPNWLILSFIVIQGIYQVIINGMGGFLFGIVGAATGVGLLIVPYLLGYIGAGDAKLLGAVGVALGGKGVFVSFLFTGAVGFVFAIVYLLKTRLLVHFIEFLIDKFAGLFCQIFGIDFKPTGAMQKHSAIKFPYAIAISLGTFFYVLAKSLNYEIL